MGIYPANRTNDLSPRHAAAVLNLCRINAKCYKAKCRRPPADGKNISASQVRDDPLIRCVNLGD